MRRSTQVKAILTDAYGTNRRLAVCWWILGKLGVTHWASKSSRTPFLYLAFSLLCAVVVFAFVDLTPRIEENFFFSTDAPQLQGTRKIDELFSVPPQLILAAEGDIRSRSYLRRVVTLTDSLLALEGVENVFSLGAGPSSVEGAIKSPLWSRLVIATDERGSNFVVNLRKQDDYGPVIEKIEALKAKHDSPEFRLAITGAPYVVHEVQKRLLDDMRTFTIAALVGFALVISAIYRSGWILFGALACATTAAFLDFIVLALLGVEPGPLSPTLWCIVFILTLSHVIFISGNWEQVRRSRGQKGDTLVDSAIRETATASLWSMVTNGLGFLTLTFTAARPIQQFGRAGLVGTVVAVAVAYSMFPAFLRLAKLPPMRESRLQEMLGQFVSKRHWAPVAAALMIAIVAAFGFNRIDTQPPVFSYFEQGGGLRSDLYRIDRLGGVSPFYIAVRGTKNETLVTNEAYLKLWDLQLALEKHHVVGEVISLASLLGEFAHSPFAPFLTWDLIYSILDLEMLGAVGRGFVTSDRKTALYVLRMKESELGSSSREEVIAELFRIVRAQGFEPVLSGGLFELTGALSTLVAKSLIQGCFGLVAMLFVIAFVVSRSLPVSVTVVSTLVIVPVTVLGSAGYFHIPLEIISTPGINLAMGLGVDEMIHLVHRAKKGPGQFDFVEAKQNLWKPIATSCLTLGLGFSVFSLSHFPPTRNMGWLVVIGTGVAFAVMLFIFPTIADRIASARPDSREHPKPQRISA